VPVIAMQVVDKQAHDKTDQLFIYTFESPALGRKTIVANLTNVYEVGDVAAVAQLGTILPEGPIKPRKVFGIDSEGMAMGPVDAAPDTDLTERFDADAPKRRFKLTLVVEAEGHYPTDAEKAARKQIKSGAGQVVAAEVVGAVASPDEG
jgi:predicted RNA-binding protein with EMAP domain